jgi:hypothetical protein
MAIIYKTLAEVKLLHEYFLTREDGTSIFAEPDQPSRMAYLRREFDEDREPVNARVGFEFPKSLQATYEGLGLKLLPTYSGFRIVARVTTSRLTDQTQVFTPAVALPPAGDILVLVTRTSPELDAVTNSRVSRAVPATYFFSNAEITGPRAFPFLTNPVPAQDPLVVYEQGELSLSGATIQEYYRRGGVDTWNNVMGAAFANESDRMLVETRFDYQFPDDDGLTQASFELSSSHGDIVSTINLSNPNGLGRKTRLDFTGKVLTIPMPGVLADAAYTLTVTGNNGMQATHTILFSNDLLGAKPWAVIALRPLVSDSAFNLLASDGFIVRRKDGLGVWTPAPMFEIAVKSRLAYWRFVHNRGKELKISAPLTGYVDKEGNDLVTRIPRAAARSWFLLNKELSTDTQYVPNPVSPEIKIEPDRRLMFDIVVPKSDLFPEVP